MKNKIDVHLNKSLKLENVLIKNVSNTLDNDAVDHLEIYLEQLINQIKVKGGSPVGPLIQYIGTALNLNKSNDYKIAFMLQTNKPINKVDPGFCFKDEISVKNCMYVRYIGLEEFIDLAYQKIQVIAFEEEIKLSGNCFIVFIDDSKEGEIIVDIFMEKSDG